MICMSLGLMIHLIDTTFRIKILMDDIIITENTKRKIGRKQLLLFFKIKVMRLETI